MIRVLAKATIWLTISLVVSGCGEKPEADSSNLVRPSAFVEYRSKRYDLEIAGECDIGSESNYSVWAFTHDSQGKPDPKGPQLHALSEESWSVVDFYPGSDERIVRIFRNGPDKFGFQDGVLAFDGELGAGITERAKVRIVCAT